MNLTIKQLRAFVAVAELQSFSLAANRLNLTTGAVSLIVRDLESEVGFVLFDRTTRRVTLASAGKSFLPAAMKVLKELQTTILTAQDVKARATGVVRVAAPLIVAMSILPPIVAAYRRESPGVMVRPVDCAVENLVPFIEDDHADLAIGPDRPTGPGVERIAVEHSRWVLWCASDHPLAKRPYVTWKSLRHESVIAAGRDHEARVAEALQTLPEEERFSPTYIVDNITTALGIAAVGLGVTLSPSYVGVLARSLNLVMRRVLKPEIVRELSVYTPAQRSMTPATESFREFVVTALSKQKPQ